MNRYFVSVTHDHTELLEKHLEMLGATWSLMPVTGFGKGKIYMVEMDIETELSVKLSIQLLGCIKLSPLEGKFASALSLP